MEAFFSWWFLFFFFFCAPLFDGFKTLFDILETLYVRDSVRFHGFDHFFSDLLLKSQRLKGTFLWGVPYVEMKSTFKRRFLSFLFIHLKRNDFAAWKLTTLSCHLGLF